MNISVVWKDRMEFNGVAGEHAVPMDAKSPVGKDSAPTPKELVVMGLGGCTAMDVIALLKKYKQPAQSFRVDLEVETSTGVQPAVFKKALLTFKVEGDVQAEKLNEAISLSQTKFCGVSAMLSQSFPIEYRVILNGQQIGQGFAKF